MYYNIGHVVMGYQAGLGPSPPPCSAASATWRRGAGRPPDRIPVGVERSVHLARWTNAIVFSILILVLVFRPHGLFGERTPEKV